MIKELTSLLFTGESAHTEKLLFQIFRYFNQALVFMEPIFPYLKK